MTGDGYVAGFSDGYDQGREQGDNDARAILTDLIAELRQASGDDRWIHLPDGHYCTPVLPLAVAADRAEARLREVGGDE
jgi:hypothetical protein